MTDGVLDVAIVGGGVSGIYSAVRLKEADASRSIAVFESSGRIGGRLLSAEPPEMPDTRAELGGMRIHSGQPKASKIVEKYGLTTYPFPVDKPENHAYLRGMHLRLRDYADPAKVPYRLTADEAGKTPGTLTIEAIERILPGITRQSPGERRERVKTAEFGGKPLYQQGFWQVLVQVMSYEAYEFAVDAGGYQSTMTSWNCADAIPWFLEDFGTGVEYVGFADGFESLPFALEDEFRSRSSSDPDPIRFGSRLRTVREDGDGFALTFADGATVRARAVILAMPRRSLELLEPTGVLDPSRHPGFWQLIRTATPRPLFKLFTVFEEPWWTATGVLQGRSVADLPVRQCYYWSEPDGEPRRTGPAMLQASYGDGDNIGFWDAFRPKRGLRDLPAAQRAQFAIEAFEGILDQSGSENWKAHRAPKAMVEEICRQLALLHNVPQASVPTPVAAAFKDWGDDPFGGGWNSWNIGVKSWEVEEQMVQPLGSTPLYVVGECWSRAQGWVEGALDTADRALQTGFGIAPPT